ncbi:hypothetical protein B296_00058347, partial [Ensete ventricosum]
GRKKRGGYESRSTVVERSAPLLTTAKCRPRSTRPNHSAEIPAIALLGPNSSHDPKQLNRTPRPSHASLPHCRISSPSSPLCHSHRQIIEAYPRSVPLARWSEEPETTTYVLRSFKSQRKRQVFTKSHIAEKKRRIERKKESRVDTPPNPSQRTKSRRPIPSAPPFA